MEYGETKILFGKIARYDRIGIVGESDNIVVIV
jgi:hypothetical protein